MKPFYLNVKLRKNDRGLIAFAWVPLMLVGALLFTVQRSFAQTAAGYTFSRTTGAFTSIAGTGTDASTVGTPDPGSGGIISDDGCQSGIPIGFTFTFCGVPYTSCTINANGVLSLQSTTPANCCSILSSDITGGGWLMPMWTDGYGFLLSLTAPSCYFLTTGTPGNQVFTVEWNSWNSCCFASSEMNFQVKLYENGNRVEFCYGPNTSGPANGPIIGIGNSSTDFQTLPTVTSTTTNTSFNTLNPFDIPNNGDILSWDPLTCAPGSRLPAVVSVYGGGGYCSGGAGVNVGISGAAVGIDYQLYLNGSPQGSPVAGPGYGFSFGLQTSPGIYTVTATNPLTGCTSNMSGSATVFVNPLPNTYNVTGGGSYCAGGSGIVVGLSNSDVGFNYQLYRNGSPLVFTIFAGTGAPLTWGPQTIAGTYTVVATNAGPTRCSAAQNGSAVVVVDPLPAAYTVTGGGSYCTGGAGLHVGLSNSDFGIDYYLYQGAFIVAGPISGNGTPIDFGAFTTGAIYTVMAMDAITACQKTMTGSAAINVVALPTAYTVTGGGGYCVGGSGMPVGLSGSDLRVNYQLYLNGSATGTPVAGTSGPITFGMQTGLGTYTISATTVPLGCTNSMSGSVVVSSNPLPTVYNMTGGGLWCGGSGTPGVAVGLSGSDVGVIYQLYRGGTTPVGGTVAGTGGSLSFGLQTIAGTYTVACYDGTTHCINNMAGSSVITVSSHPTSVAMTGGGSYCIGGSGVNVGLAGSSIGIDYQLYLGGIATGSPVSGTGTALSFGLQTTVGTYTAVATNPLSGCTNNMSGSVNVSISSLPNIYGVTGGGTFCIGGAGVNVGISGSDVGVYYQLYRGGVATSGSVAGTGSAVGFPLQTVAGVYTVMAVGSVSTCASSMTGSATVSVTPRPTVYAVTGGGSYCPGGAGVHVGLSNSDIGINYQLYLGAITVGSPVAGTGAPLDFGAQTTTGPYTVKATDATVGCMNNMSGSATVSISPTPYIFSVTGGGSYCAGGIGMNVYLASSVAFTDYQLYLGGSPVGSPVAGTGTTINFGLQTSPGVYTVVGTSTITGCTANMAGSATVSVITTPAAYTVTGGGGYCSGSAAPHVGLSGSSTGVSYVLYRGASPVSTMAGTGAALDFGAQATAGSYSVIATISGTACVSTMVGAVSVSANALPTVYTLSGGGSLCSGGSGFHIILSNSDIGVNYQLYLGATPIGSPVSGIGSSIDFGLQTSAGTYGAVATNATTSCVSNMSGHPVISAGAAPVAYTVTGGGSYCTGSSAPAVFLSGSQVGVNYQLYNGGSAVGTPKVGTGGALNFGIQTVAGTYTIVATTASAGCTNTMTGSVTITINPLPAAYTVTGGGAYCSGSSGVAVGLATSDAGVNYRLYRGGGALSTIVAGTGAAISFGLQTTAGTYTVVATDATTGCTRTMSGSAVVSVSSGPAIVSVTGGGGYCSGGTGVHVRLSGSAIGVNYQLYLGGSPVGSPVAGIGAGLDFGLQTAGGTYTATATIGSSSCTASMAGSVAVTVYTVPAVYSVTGGGGYCSGGTGVHIYLSGSSTGTTYKMYNTGTPVTGTTTGTGSSLSFGLNTAAGTYTVIATAGSTGCTSTMSGSAVVTVNPLPTVTGSIYTLMPGTTITLTSSLTGGTWSSSNASVATVSGGTVTGVTLGTAVITYTHTTGCTGTHIIYVTATGHREDPFAAPAAGIISSVSVMPNPSKGAFTVKGTVGNGADAQVTLEVTDMMGRSIYRGNTIAADGKLEQTIDMGHIANGMYLLSIHSEADNRTLHIVVEQ